MNKDLIVKVGLTFYICSILGFFYELFVCLLYNGKVFSHGFFHGPWLPIYGLGAVLIQGLRQFKDEPLVIFFASLVLTAFVEGLSGFLLLKIFHTRLWDYTGYIGNIGGFVCLLSSFCFGVGGLIVTYFINPFIEKILKLVNKTKLQELLYIFTALFGIDIIATSLN